MLGQKEWYVAAIYRTVTGKKIEYVLFWRPIGSRPVKMKISSGQQVSLTVRETLTPVHIIGLWNERGEYLMEVAARFTATRVLAMPVDKKDQAYTAKEDDTQVYLLKYDGMDNDGEIWLGRGRGYKPIGHRKRGTNWHAVIICQHLSQ